MRIKEPQEYIIIEFRESTINKPKKIKTISVYNEDLKILLNEVIAVSELMEKDFNPVSTTPKGKPKFIQTTVLIFNRIGNKKGSKSKSSTIYGVKYDDLYNKIIQIYK